MRAHTYSAHSRRAMRRALCVCVCVCVCVPRVLTLGLLGVKLSLSLCINIYVPRVLTLGVLDVELSVPISLSCCAAADGRCQALSSSRLEHCGPRELATEASGEVTLGELALLLDRGEAALASPLAQLSAPPLSVYYTYIHIHIHIHTHIQIQNMRHP